MEGTLETGDFVSALSYLDRLITSCPPENWKTLLSNHTFRGMPTLHLLARWNIREEDIPHLDKIIRTFLAHGYDVNFKMYPTQEETFPKESHTALQASILNGNRTLMESLLLHGVRADICTLRGYSPCHLAIKKGDLDCLKILIKYGGPSILSTTTKMGWSNIRPLLHTAVDEGRLDILAYLLSVKGSGLSIQETTSYGGTEYTVLERALSLWYKETFMEVVRILLESLYKDPRFSELYSRMAEGDTKMACTLLERFTPEELASARIDNRWALHCLHTPAFEKESRVEFTKKLISHFVQSGWNLNSESDSMVDLKLYSVDGYMFDETAKVSNCTLLHIACFSSAKPEMIKWLLEAGAEVNCRTEGRIEVTPLLILMGKLEWEGARYLIEKRADLNVRGNFGKGPAINSVSHFMRRNLSTGEWEPMYNLNAVELLLRLRYEVEFGEGMDLLEMMFSNPTYVSNPTAEFHLAMEGFDLRLVNKVLHTYGERISSEDLKWMAYCGEGDAPVMVPSICVLLLGLQFAEREPVLTEEDVRILANLIGLMVNAGLDLNIRWEKEFTSIFSIFALRLSWDSTEILTLLKTLLAVKHLQLNVNHRQPYSSPILILRDQLKDSCQYSEGCAAGRRKYSEPFWPVEATKILITHGMDWSEEVIDKDFKFHSGYTDMCKLMFAAGAIASTDFFDDRTLCRYADEELKQEFAELKVWKDDFDRKEGRTLKHLCRLAIRKRIKFVKDLEMLNGLSKSERDYVLCRNCL